VVHLAGRVHVLREAFADPEAEFHRVNVLGTERLARAAADAGVERLVFVSSVGVHGQATSGLAFTEEHEPSPRNVYAVSKWDAERAVREVAAETGLEYVILRPPLIYGPGVKANFLRLLEVVDRRLPLPFGSIDNRRSLLYVGNMADAIVECASNPRAAGETFLLSDGEDVSTPDLVRRISIALGRHPLVLPFPLGLIRVLGQLTGRAAMIEPLLDSLVVDSGKVRRTLDWKPPHTLEEGLRDTARWFKGRR
jgi:nucleoside-diphosphate-sugar epimerase